MTDKRGAGLDVKTGSSLSKKVSKGVLWVTATKISGRGLNLVSAVILARLLAPSDFGLMAISMAIIAFSQGTTQTGFESAIIQKQDKPEDFLNTAWTFELVRYLVLFLILILVAPLLASFFQETRAVAILRVISISLVFHGLRNIGVVYFRKNLDFHKQLVLEIVPLMINICVVIPLAFVLRNVWALVWASLARSITVLVLSYVMHRYRPRLEFKIKKAKELFNFGKWILGSSILVMIRNQGMTMFAGKFFTMSILGFYNRAETFSTMIFQQISQIVWKVGYPAYSQLQVNPTRFKNAYLKTLQLLTFIGIPMAGGLFVLSRDFVHLFLTDKWLPIVPLIQILCLQAIFNFINTPAGIAFQASGKPAINTKISMLGIIILVIIVYPLSSRWGITGAVSSLFLSVMLPSPIVWYMAIRITKCSFTKFIKAVLFPLINTGVMVSVILVIKNLIVIQLNFASFFGLVLFGIMIYAVVALFFERCMGYGCYGLIRERMTAIR